MFEQQRNTLRNKSTDSDCGVCGWPWQGVCAGEADGPSLATSKRFITVKITMGWSACEKIQLFFVVFCVVRFVHKLYFRLHTNGTPTKWQTANQSSCNDKDSSFWYSCVLASLVWLFLNYNQQDTTNIKFWLR